MKWMARSKPEQNKAAIDPWTLVHFASGLAAGLVGMSFARAAGLALAYEAFEQVFERQRVGQELLETSGPERVPNALVDLAVFAAGHRFGAAWNRTAGDPDDGP